MSILATKPAPIVSWRNHESHQRIVQLRQAARDAASTHAERIAAARRDLANAEQDLTAGRIALAAGDRTIRLDVLEQRRDAAQRAFATASEDVNVREEAARYYESTMHAQACRETAQAELDAIAERYGELVRAVLPHMRALVPMARELRQLNNLLREDFDGHDPNVRRMELRWPSPAPGGVDVEPGLLETWLAEAARRGW